MGGWLVIKKVLRFSSFSGISTSKICWFQIWSQKLSTVIRLKVMGKLLLKFLILKADFRGGKWPKIMIVTNNPSAGGANWGKFHFQLLLIFCNVKSNFLDIFFFNFLNLHLEERSFVAIGCYIFWIFSELKLIYPWCSHFRLFTCVPLEIVKFQIREKYLNRW